MRPVIQIPTRTVRLVIRQKSWNFPWQFTLMLLLNFITLLAVRNLTLSKLALQAAIVILFLFSVTHIACATHFIKSDKTYSVDRGEKITVELEA